MSYGYFSPKDIPNGICDRHVLCEYDFLTEGMAFDGCDSEYVKLVSLLDISDRSFPCQIYITDAEFVYRKIDCDAKLGDSYDVPYFVFTLEEGEYVGKSRSKKQFNSACYIHSD